MADGMYLIFGILVAASCRDVLGREFIASHDIEHWLRALAPPDDCNDASAAGKQVTDPDDCTKFFICTAEGQQTADSYACADYDPTFACFDPAKKVCDVAGTGCDAACLVTVPTCQTECKLSLDIIADITDCSRHFLCLADGADSGTIELYCPADRPYFNGEKCTNDKSACCSCQPETCATAGDLIADPEDCHSFFTCVDLGGTPTPVGPIPCGGSGSFINGACDSATTECENACDLGEGSSTSSTISTASTPTSASSDSTASSLDSTASDSTASTLTTASSDSTGSTSESTSDSTVTTVSSTPTTSSGTECIDLSDFTCLDKGFYARCPFCDASYFSCDRNGAEPLQGYCAGDLVFNPNPDFPYCVLPVNCPYFPPQ